MSNSATTLARPRSARRRAATGSASVATRASPSDARLAGLGKQARLTVGDQLWYARQPRCNRRDPTGQRLHQGHRQALHLAVAGDECSAARRGRHCRGGSAPRSRSVRPRTAPATRRPVAPRAARGRGLELAVPDQVEVEALEADAGGEGREQNLVALVLLKTGDAQRIDRALRRRGARSECSRRRDRFRSGPRGPRCHRARPRGQARNRRLNSEIATTKPASRTLRASID